MMLDKNATFLVGHILQAPLSLNPLRHQIPPQLVIGERERATAMPDDGDSRPRTERDFLTLRAKNPNLACPSESRTITKTAAMFGIQRASSPSEPLTDNYHDEGRTERGG